MDLSAFEIGLLVSAAQLAPLVGLLVAGELLDRFDERLVVWLGSLIVAAAIACASFASSYPWLLACLTMGCWLLGQVSQLMLIGKISRSNSFDSSFD